MTLTPDDRANLRRLLDERATLLAGIKAVQALISESHGVAGLHLNGDLSPWAELQSGGRFEQWLYDFDRAAELFFSADLLVPLIERLLKENE